MTPQPKLGIALGSGSARGWAHIGVLEALAEEGIAPGIVAGCSMGAMVGAAFSAGRIEQLHAWALSLDWKRVVGLADFGLGGGGLFKGDRLLSMFQGQFVKCLFSELLVPFAAVATDLTTGEEVWLREGFVCDAVRDSCTVPGLFRPVLRGGRYLVDGSVVNPVPVSLCRAMGADVVIAVDLGSQRPKRVAPESQSASNAQLPRRGLFNVLAPSAPPPPPSIMDTLLNTIDIMQEHISQSRMAKEPPDVLLAPDLERFGRFEYYRAAAAIAAGREIVSDMIPDIRRVLKGEIPRGGQPVIT